MKRHFVYAVSYNDGNGYSEIMGSVDAPDDDEAVRMVWHDVIQYDYEDEDFDGIVQVYDT